MLLKSWRRNTLRYALTSWNTITIEELQKMFDDGKMDQDDYVYITGQTYTPKKEENKEPQQIKSETENENPQQKTEESTTK